MTRSNSQAINFSDAGFYIRHPLSAFLLAFLLIFPIYAQQQSVSQANEKIIIADGAQVFSWGKTVVVPKEAKGVLVVGGDVIVEGSVEEDVATIGGSVTQKQNAFIGGDVIVIGGTYTHESREPLRGEGKQSIVFKGFEDELRSMTQNPSQIFAPEFTWFFLAQRLLSILFWFVVSLSLTTIAPGAVSRSIARFRLSTPKIVGIGFLGFLTIFFGVVLGLKFLPSYLSAIIWLMSFLTLLLAYVFGRGALQVSSGKWLQKRLLPENLQSESIAFLAGAVLWTFLLSLPYIWTFALLFLFAASLGTILTARSSSSSAGNRQKF